MPFVVTKSCCTDASCVSVCPVGCIHPAPGEPGFGTSEILHIDPASCIDCGACADACPTEAIYPLDRLGSGDTVYADINAQYYAERSGVVPLGMPRPAKREAETPAGQAASADSSEAAPTSGRPAATTDYPVIPVLPQQPHVAVVGTGPAGMYTVKELLTRTDADITVIDALPTPGGLIRSGVAPDHPATKGIQRTFDLALSHPRVTFLGGITVGQDVQLHELRQAFHATFLATGARSPRRLDVPGEDLPGVVSADRVVSWAGGVPGHDDSPLPAASQFASVQDAGAAEPTRRAVIVGTGNVALDLVRLLLTPPEILARTDVADRALRVLDDRPIDDVVVVGRGPRSRAAYTEAEFRALPEVPGLEVRVIDSDDSCAAADLLDHPGSGTRVTFLFGTTVDRFSAISAAPSGAPDPEHLMAHLGRSGGDIDLPSDLVITSLGYQAIALPGAPFDALRGGIAHDEGRVRGTSGLYVVGWAKRGANGGIGTNRGCAQESVDSFLADARVGLPRTRMSPHDIAPLARHRGAEVVDKAGARRIDRTETLAGTRSGRPRVKLTMLEDLHAAARTRFPRRRAS